MDILPEVNFIATAYEEITNISQREKIERIRNEKQEIVYISTLEKLEVWMKYNDWATSPVDTDEFFRLIMMFHSIYVNERLK